MVRMKLLFAIYLSMNTLLEKLIIKATTFKVIYSPLNKA
ncbi:hypothetical protein B4080_3748 [Bacillus cereus]|nr:hypothetical protein B4080_3748 [Bacillus cereus]